MCAINPTHKKRFILDVYTSRKFSEEEWNQIVIEAALKAEIDLNRDARLRWHLKETKQEAD